MSILRRLGHSARMLSLFLMVTLVAACGGGGGGGGGGSAVTHTVSASAGSGGSISPASRTVDDGNTTTFTVTADAGYSIASVSGCNGTLSGNTYTTGTISADCTVTASFTANTHAVSAEPLSQHGTIGPGYQEVTDGATANLTVTPDDGYNIESISGCNGTLSGTTYTTGPVYADCTVTVTFIAGPAPVQHTIATGASPANGGTASGGGVYAENSSITVTATPNTGYNFVNWTEAGSPVSTAASYTFTATADRSLVANFVLKTYTVTASAGTGGAISPASRIVTHGDTTTFTITPNSGYAAMVTGCGGALSGATYTTGAITGACTVSATFITAPAAPSVSVSGSAKRITFSWGAVSGASYYQLLDGASGYSQVGGNLTATSTSIDVSVHQFDWDNAVYAVNACNIAGCNAGVADITSLTEQDAIGYFKAETAAPAAAFGWRTAVSADGNTVAVSSVTVDNFGGVDVYVRNTTTGVWSLQEHLIPLSVCATCQFGSALALSADGDTLAVGALNDVHFDAVEQVDAPTGGVYVFVRDGSDVWSEQAHLSASNPGFFDRFGGAVSLSSNGNLLAVGAYGESSAATGFDGNAADNSAASAGAAYLFTRSGTAWSQTHYVKASDTVTNDMFGSAVALSGDGNTLVVGAPNEDSAGTDAGRAYIFTHDISTGDWAEVFYLVPWIGDGDAFGATVALDATGQRLAVGAPYDDGATDSNADAGAVYIFTAQYNAGLESTEWLGTAVRASNGEAGDRFGSAVALSGDGLHLAVGASGEDGSSNAINGIEVDNTAPGAGAVYVYDTPAWAQSAYVKAPNTDASDTFGISVALDSDGGTLVVGAPNEDSSASGVGSGTDLSDNSLSSAGAAYLY